MRTMLRSLAFASFTVLCAAVVPALTAAQEPNTPANRSDDPLLRGFRWRSIGPAGQGGRVDDIAVVERNPSTYYIGFATGGVWKTVNNGVTFEPIFDTYGTHSIGDIAIAQSNPDILYVGTGEPNNRQSSSFGDGIYKSTDGGKTFANVGLREVQSIARVVVHPTNPNVVWVAAVGHLFGPNAERGVFRTADGGRTWNKVLFVDENTGATDVAIHPRNPDVLFATMYQRRRTPWGFASGGDSGGIWRSNDGGQRWTKVSGGGLPTGSMGRIGIDFSRSNPNVIYAQIETAPDKLPVDPQAAGRGGRGGGGGGGGGGRGSQELPPDPNTSGIWRSSDGGRAWQFTSNQNNRPMYYSQIRVDPNNENVVYVGGASASKSINGGRTFEQLTGFGHGDHHAIWINPSNSNHVMYGNDGSIDVSWDGAQNWQSIRTWAVGQPYHASVDMRRPYYVCAGLQDNGSWCGPSATRGGALLNQDWYRVGGGDGFYTAVDPTDWTVVYSESQDGNTNRLDLRTGTSVSIRPRGTESGADGGGGFGGGAPPNVVPPPPPNTQFRFNWNTPFTLSPHDPNTVILGGDRFFVSRDRGTTWSMSPDLTKTVRRDDRDILGMKGSLPNCGRQRVGACILSKNDGTVSYSTIVSVSESPVTPGVYWAGTDDGNIQVSRDGGATWTEVGKNLPGGPKEYYVSRVEASHFDAGTAYASLDGHKSNDLRPYAFVTRDFGQTWTALANNLPAWGNVNTIREDPKNPSLLYVGTEFGFHVSLDAGRTWKRFMTNLPVVRIDDVLVHPRENDLVLATHGRSIWIMDDVTALQQLTPATMAQDVVLFTPRNAVAWKNDIRLSRAVTGAQNFRGENAAPGTAISYYLKNAASGEVKITIRDLASGDFVRTITGTGLAGLNRVQWNLCSDLRPVAQGGRGGRGGGGGGGGGCGGGRGGGGGGGGADQTQGVARMATPGAYMVTLTVGGRDYSRSVTVLEDVWMN